MRYTIGDPHVARLFLALFRNQRQTVTPFDINWGVEKAQRDLRQLQAEALVRADEVILLSAELRAVLGDLRADHPDVPARNRVYLDVMEALGGLTPASGLATIERLLRLPIVVVEPNTPRPKQN